MNKQIYGRRQTYSGEVSQERDRERRPTHVDGFIPAPVRPGSVDGPRRRLFTRAEAFGEVDRSTPVRPTHAPRSIIEDVKRSAPAPVRTGLVSEPRRRLFTRAEAFGEVDRSTPVRPGLAPGSSRGGERGRARGRRGPMGRRAVIDKRPINVRITNNSDYSITYSIQSAIPSAAFRDERLNPGTSADKYMRKDDVYGWPTLNLFYVSKSGLKKAIESYTPSKYIPNLYVTIENDDDILDIQFHQKMRLE